MHGPAPLPLALVKCIAAGRATGKYNLTGKGLEDLPKELWDENLPLPAAGAQPGGAAWWEICEPQRLDLSRNRLSYLSPDVCNWPSLTLLDVSHNQMAQLPDDLRGLQNLGSLLANNNNLHVLPALPNSLVVLHAQQNRLATLTDSLAACTGLTHLDAASNQLQHIPPQLTIHCSALAHLSLSNNQLTALPADLRGLTRLKVLDVQHNRLQALPASLAACQALVELHAGHNQLQYVPAELSACLELRHLSVRDNRITDFPVQLCALQLSVLDLQNCDLSSLPPDLGHMTTLRGLLLEGNPLRTMRRLIGGPVSATLKYLRSRLPEEGSTALGACTQQVRSGNVFGFDAHALAADMAHKLAVSNNLPPAAAHLSPAQTHGLPPQPGYQAAAGHDTWGAHTSSAPAPVSHVSATAGRHAAGQPHLHQGPPAGQVPSRAPGAGRSKGPELVLAASGLTEVPEQVWAALPGLHKLDLSSNQLRHLPPEGFLHAAALRTLLLNRLPITCWPLPPAPACLASLATLSLAGCSRITHIPPGALVSCEASLTSLDLSGVPAAGHLPQGTIARCLRLELLDLSQTGLTVFPHETLQLGAALKTLRLANNKISVLPEEVCEMTRLSELHLSNNELSSLPPSLGHLADSLRALTVEGNPLRTIRRAVLDKGTVGILAYLKDRIPVS